MSKLIKELVNICAEEILIELTEEENNMVIDEFNVINKKCDIFNEMLNIDEIQPMTHCLDEFIVELREDEVEESVPIDDLLKNSDETTYREIELPKVVS